MENNHNVVVSSSDSEVSVSRAWEVQAERTQWDLSSAEIMFQSMQEWRRKRAVLGQNL